MFFFFQAEDGIRDPLVTGVQTCALPICCSASTAIAAARVALRKTRSRRRCPAACRGSMAATVFIADGSLSQARRTLDARLPGRTDLLDQAVGQRDVAQLGRHPGTVVIGPVKEPER